VRASGLNIVVLGLSLSSSWGNGHATTYRALIKALAERGHRVLFLERNVRWYAAHRDITDPEYCRLALYDGLDQLRRHHAAIARADAVIVGSYVPQGIDVIRWVLDRSEGVKAFYDIDTPVTLAAVEAGTCTYLAAHQIPEFDLYLSFTGGPLLQRLVSRHNARAAAALYCSVDADAYRPQRRRRDWDLGYLGTYSADRQPALERLLLEPARRSPNLRFVIAGAQYPSTSTWPANVQYIEHLPPTNHPGFYSSLRWALNITRADMVKTGYSPSVRLFEAAACGTPIISDSWPGLDTLFAGGREIIVAGTTEAAIEALTMPDKRRRDIGKQARHRILQEHTSRHRAARLEALLLAAIGRAHASKRKQRHEPKAEPKRATYVSTAKVLT
jgi:spore maturation protein CgeB